MKRGLWLLAFVCLATAGVLLMQGPWPDAPRPDAPEVPSSRDIHVEVLNGCGEDGVARAVGNRLRGLGFDVVTVENAESFNYPETIVIDRVGKPDLAHQVADAIKVKNCIQQIIPDPFRIEEVTVVVGRDHGRLGLALDR
jgi:hypothetical protein